MAIGYKGNNSDYHDEIQKIEYIEKDKIIEHKWINDFRHYNLKFFSAVAKNINGDFSSGTSTSQIDAIFKASIEGYERWASSNARIDFTGAANQLDNWIHPSLFFPYTEEQRKKENLVKFTEDLSINWTIGKTSMNTQVFIPSDVIYYGHQKYDRIAISNSSGVAAHLTLKNAEKNAIEEAIERDAIIRAWNYRETNGVINDKILPIFALDRIKYWKKYNRRLSFVDLKSKWGLVVLCIIFSEKWPCFVCGAAGTINKSVYEIVNKSMREAELMLASTLDFSHKEIIKAEEVETPLDHGNFISTKIMQIV